MNPPISLIMVQFLTWVAEREHSYAETMEAWRTSCPRLSVWEDASLDGLIRLEAGTDGRSLVRLTAHGRAALESSKLSPKRVTQEA